MKIETSRKLRRKGTPAEIILWRNVRNREFLNTKFLRQHPIPFKIDGMKRFFVADFYCYASKLVIEIDGGIHETQQEYDALRTFVIQQLGIKVIRFSNEDIEHHLDNVMSELKKALTPQPRLSNVSEGELQRAQ
jgi:very-short-patch-repair endonuclease